MTAHEGRLWVFAGGYKDSTSVMAFSNDVHAFNTATWEWEAVRVFGAPPLAMWSHAAVLLGSRLLVQGGCTLTEWFWQRCPWEWACRRSTAPLRALASFRCETQPRRCPPLSPSSMPGCLLACRVHLAACL
jgi:hypothetical protein